MEDEKRRNQTPTVRKINYSKLLLFSKLYSKLLLFSKLSFKNNPHKNNYLSSKSTSKKAYFIPKKKAIHINKKLLEEKDKKVQELQLKLEKEQDERYKCQVKYLCLQQAYEQQKLIEEHNDINNFIDFEDEPYILHYLISELFILCYDLIKEFLTQKYNKLLISLNLPSTENGIDQIAKTLKPFILENMSAIVFNDQENDIFLDNFKKNYKENYIKNINERLDEFEDIIHDKSFKVMLNNVKNLTLFALFNEPILYFDVIKDINKRKIEIIKVNNDTQKYIIVNFDGSEKFEGIILLNPPITKSGNTIAILSDLKKVILKCNKEQIDKLKEKEEFNLTLNNNKSISKFKRNTFKNIQKEFNDNSDFFLLYKTSFYSSFPSLNLYNSKTQIINDYSHHTSKEEYYLIDIYQEKENKKEVKLLNKSNEKIDKKEKDNNENTLKKKTIQTKDYTPLTKNQINSLISLTNRKLMKIYEFQVKKKYSKNET